MTATAPVPTTSPWGKVQDAKVLAPGVVAVSTAGHGGIKLDRAANARVPKPFRRPGGWYEEDCEALIPHHFLPELRAGRPPEKQDEILRGVKDWYWKEWEEYARDTLAPGESRRKDEAVWREAHRDRFVAVSALRLADGTVGVKATRPSDGASGWWAVPAEEYARRGFGFVVDEARHARSERPLF